MAIILVARVALFQCVRRVDSPTREHQCCGAFTRCIPSTVLTSSKTFHHLIFRLLCQFLSYCFPAQTHPLGLCFVMLLLKYYKLQFLLVMLGFVNRGHERERLEERREKGVVPSGLLVVRVGIILPMALHCGSTSWF